MPATYKAFVSSTFEDLKEHRAFVIRALRAAGLAVDPMEDWPADADVPRRFAVDRLEGCDLHDSSAEFTRTCYVVAPFGEKRAADKRRSGHERRSRSVASRPSAGTTGTVPAALRGLTSVYLSVDPVAPCATVTSDPFVLRLLHGLAA